MKGFVLTILRRLSWLENYLPAGFSIRLRYQLQKWLGFLEPEFDLLPLLTRKDGLAIDAGANTGVFSLRLSELASQVYAFEPIEWLADRLKKACIPRVCVEHAALSDANGTANIQIPVMGGVVRHTRASLSGAEGKVIEQQVTLRTLDSYCLDNVGFIKIDVEGHERPLLIGAEETILRNKPNIFIELENWRLGDLDIQDLFGIFLSWGYQGHFYWQGKLLGVNEFDVLVHQASRENVYKHDDYVNNFIFLPADTSLKLPSSIRR